MLRFLLPLFFLILLVPGKGIAQKIILLDDSTREFTLHHEYLGILEDPEKKWTIDDVVSPQFDQKFSPDKSGYPYNERVQSVYWIRFKVQNVSSAGRNFLLESYAPHTNSWDVYIPEGNGYRLKRSGLDLHFYDREYVNKNLILDLPLDSGKVHTFYVRVLSQNHSSFDYRIKPLHYFFYYSVNEYYFLGMYYGIMFIMAIYNLLIFLSLREKVYIYYVLYILCGIMTSLADDGIGYQYVWVNFPHINSHIGVHFAPVLLLLTFILYSREFLRLKRKYPLYNKIVLGATGFYLVYYVLKLLVLPPYLHFHGFYVLPFIIVYILAIKIYFNGYKPARFLIIGFGFILISIVIIKLRSNGSIEGNLFTVYSLNYGLVMEILVLSFALAERVRYAKKEKEKALRERNKAQYNAIKQLRINENLKDKVNRELEQKVAERTHELHEKNAELEETNRKLKEMTDRANEMSLKLDADNWNLQKKVLESIQERLVGQEVSYSEFNKLFPNETACFRYLYELKWGNGYQCKRCRGMESTTEEKLFSKKCVRCGYYESVTAHTLFHAIKFPVNKAFYMVYLIIYQSDKMTLQDLASLLELQKNTCWKFKQKIQLAIEQYNHTRKKSDPLNSWEKIIFSSVSEKKKLSVRMSSSYRRPL